jgi:hypothetical protein
MTMLRLDTEGRVLPRQQARLGAFLVSAYGALARLGIMQGAWAGGPAGVALQAQGFAAAGLVSSMLRATAWQPDPWVVLHLPLWEAAWLLRPGPADALALGLAIETVVRPMPLLPPGARQDDGFAAALLLAEAEAGRLLQPNVRLLKAMVPATPRAEVEAAAERRRELVATLWTELLAALDEI